MMRHTPEQLFDIVYNYYPREITRQDPRYEQTEQYARLSAARRKAGADHEEWRAMLRRLRQQFPSQDVVNHSLHLPTGAHDAGYSGKVFLPAASGEHSHWVGFFVSFLVPYYLVHSSRIVDDPEQEELSPDAVRFKITVPWDEETDAPGTSIVEDWKPSKRTRELIGFEFSPDEEPYATHIAKEIEATWSYDPLPPEVGKVVVPDVATNLRMLGEATLYDCLVVDS